MISPAASARQQREELEAREARDEARGGCVHAPGDLIAPPVRPDVDALASGGVEEIDYAHYGFHRRLKLDREGLLPATLAFYRAGYVLEHACAVDLRATEGVMRLVYQFNHFGRVDRHVCHVDLKPEAGAPYGSAPTVTGIYGGADWLEREIREMHGVHFEGHPDTRPLLLPEHATFHPLLKDFDITQADVELKRFVDEPSLVGANEDRDTYYLNMGPQHPSMHGVLRIRLHMRGERILGADTIIGYAHRAHEAMAENREYIQFYPNSSRIDYLSGMIYNFAYCQALERALGIAVPERTEYIRVICSELNRIQSHLLWLGTFLLDLGGVTPFLYCFDDRERILDILDRITGSRLTYCYGRVGGLTQDVDDIFLRETAEFCARLRKRMPEYLALVEQNVIFRNRCLGIGVFSPAIAHSHALSGPVLRAIGTTYDVRRAEPYSIYDRFNFDLPIGTTGDCYDRFDVRLREMEQSMRIIEQALAGLPEGPFQTPKMPKQFKLPAGEYYHTVESARGQFGIYIAADGSPKPVRLKLRTPSFATLSTLPIVMPGTTVADTIAIVGSIDIVLPEVDR